MHQDWAKAKNNLLQLYKDSGLQKTVISQLQVLEHKQNHLKFSLPNTLSMNIAKNELDSFIKSELQSVLGLQFNTEYITQEQFELPVLAENLDSQNSGSNQNNGSSQILREPEIKLKPKWFLNQDYTLANFVNGQHANFAVNCINELVKGDQTFPFRQLFLYGNSGLGKTHLLHALGWQFKIHQPQLNVKVVSSDEFINDYHMYLAKKQMAEFRGKYRLKTDVLLIDDIHTMARAKSAQEELFNIFNYFEQTKKFIAFTSDKSPHQLENFEARLLTRFQGGISAQIDLPELKTRMQIIEFKQLKYGLMLSKEILNQIATSITNSIRSLEGALFKVGTFQQMKGSRITLDEVKKLLPPSASSSSNLNGEITVDSILAVAALESKLKISDLKSNSRKREIVSARNQAMYKMREQLGISYAEIGRFFQKDHSTVISGINRISDMKKMENNLLN